MRDILAVLYLLLFIPAWFVFLVWTVINLDLSTIEALGLGAVTGNFITCFVLMWQFYFRKKES